MSLWLDSNVILWWLEASPRLDSDLLQRLEHEQPLTVSVVSPWELWIKAAQGKLQLPGDLEERLAYRRIEVARPTLQDARLAASLPPLHRDPFDRMIVAQALNAGATIVTGDAHFAQYGVDVILV